MSEEGLFPVGHRQDQRPELPQVKIMQAVLEPLGMPLATAVVSGERADDPLAIACIKRVQQSLGRNGLLLVGDGKMAAQGTRAFMALAGDSYRCPLPQAPLDEGDFDEALDRVDSAEPVLSEVFREPEPGHAVRMAPGDESNRPMSVSLGDTEGEWTERRLVVRSVRHAESAQAALQGHVAKAKAPVEARHPRGRGRKRDGDLEAWRQALQAIVPHHRVEAFWWLGDDPQTTSRSVRAYQDRPAYVKEESQATVAVRVDEAALEVAARRLGWRLYRTKQALEPLSLEQAVWAYRSESLVQRRLGRL